MNIRGAVGGGSMTPEAKSLYFVWPFLPYHGLENTCGKEKKTQFIIIDVSGISVPITKNSFVLGRAFFLVTLRLTGQLCS